MATDILLAWAPFLVLVAIGVAWTLLAKRKFRTLPSPPKDLFGPVDSITIAREKKYNAAGRRFSVLIDGVAVGEIGSGEVKHFPTIVGKHTVEVQIDWCKSRSLAIEKKANANLPLRCGTTYDGLGALYTAFIKTRDYVYVRSDG